MAALLVELGTTIQVDTQLYPQRFQYCNYHNTMIIVVMPGMSMMRLNPRLSSEECGFGTCSILTTNVLH